MVIGGARFRLAVFCLALTAASGCGDDGGSESGSKPKAKPERVLIESVDQANDAVAAKAIVMSGTVSEPGATVTVGDKTVKANSAGVFRARVRLDELGQNYFVIKASKSGFKSDAETVFVKRKLTAEQIAARDAAREERKRLQREREIAELRASAEALDPKQFQKDPDRYIGQKVTMSGEIFQIQEGGDNFFLMTTMCDTSYEVTLCEGPDVYVTYDFPTDKTQEDFVTVYGEVQGGHQYDTNIGGSNYVGHIKARIVE